MGALRLILGDQLSLSISSLEDTRLATDLVLMCEVSDQLTRVKHHIKKLAFILSAMRHFASELEANGHQVAYSKLDDATNTDDLKEEVRRTIKQYKAERIVVTSPSDYDTLQDIAGWQDEFGIPIEIRNDTRFLCSEQEFQQWASNRKQLRMELFYREMRKKHSILIEDNKPVGGKWNYDSENRKPPKNGLSIPKPYVSKPDQITRDVLKLVTEKFSSHFGHLHPFYFAVTRTQALSALKLFIDERLISFGDYQDAMIEKQPWMYHSHISFYLNCGLLLPQECIDLAEQAYQENKAPLNAVEGFIRQILGWREYVRGIYWMKMPDYPNENFFGAKRKLPEFYWTGETQLNCLHNCVSETQQNAYAHHIQRLMILGNFALIAGIDPIQVNEWFLIVYADAYEWVELPNVSGMTLFADGGYLASKPYAAGGNYINKMSNYCGKCTYSVNKKSGPDACPFNYLYWDFLERNRNKLSSNHRVSMMYKTYDRMALEKKESIKTESSNFLDSLD